MNLLIISHYEPRGLENIVRCLKSLESFEPGCNYEIALISNIVDTNYSIDFKDLQNKFKSLPLNFYFTRENKGMNIGAWEFGWRKLNQYDNYLFMQDEVIAMQDNWFVSFLNKHEELKNLNKFIVLGESNNYIRNKPWKRMIKLINHYRIYYDKLIEWGIDPGKTPLVLRSLIIFMNKETLEKVNGFHIGNCYRECIASEFAITKKIEQINGFAELVGDNPFTYLYHTEWLKNGKRKKPSLLDDSCTLIP